MIANGYRPCPECGEEVLVEFIDGHWKYDCPKDGTFWDIFLRPGDKVVKS